MHLRTTTTMTALLLLGCARGELYPNGQASELQEQYSERENEIDECMSRFGECTAAADDNSALSNCAEELQVCLALAPDEDGGQLPGEEESGGEIPPDDESTDSGGPSQDEDGAAEDGMSEGPDEDGQDEDGQPVDEDPIGEICDPILQACLDDPSQFDPFCLDDFEECVAVEVALELKELCQEVQAQCLELDIPNYDCFELCT